MGLFFLAFTVVGVIFFLMVKKGADQGAEGAMGVAYLILAIFGGLGVIGMAIAAVAVALEARVRPRHGPLALGMSRESRAPRSYACPPSAPVRSRAGGDGRVTPV